MKLITAIVPSDKLDCVREALYEADIKRITISRVTGHGQQEPLEDMYRGVKVVPRLVPKIRIDIACNDEFVDACCNAIISSARHGDGEIGDGKIFITSLEECIRIRTEERGNAAI